MPRVSFYTLGCKLNYAETSTLQRDFEARRFETVSFGEAADVTVINTCTVTEEADRKCRQTVRRALRANPDAFVIVTGCYAQLQPDVLAAIEGVDAVLGASEKFRLFHLIDEFSKGEATQIAVSCIDEATAFGPAFSSGERTRAFLKVQDGCDYSCAFCTIPLARGRSRSQPVAETVGQARHLAAQGYREIVLSGINIGLYGEDHGSSLLPLLQALDEVEGIDRYRISSIEPNLLTDSLIVFVAASRRFQPHFHLPLQSGDDYVLGKMRRRYRRGLYAERVAHIKRLMPYAGIGADVIVGFPAEDEARFETTYRFIQDLPLAYLHVFTYSERADTIAVDQPERTGGTSVPKAERSRRNRMLRILSEKKRHAFYQAHLSDVRPVLWEDAERGGAMHGFTDNYVKVGRPYDSERAGQIEDVRLGALTEDGTVTAEDAAFVSLL
ncbi:MAG: tRNA (N(6)-L-threonylcarbamoyladenosine(37)-C(2))-methylthiotransferase MtaB [Rhodothermales bacterium]